MNDEELKEEYRRLVKKLKESGKDPKIKIRNEDIADSLGYKRTYFSSLLGESGKVTAKHIKDLMLNFPTLRVKDAKRENKNDEPLIKTISELSSSNKTLAEANKTLAEAHYNISRNIEDLIQMAKVAFNLLPGVKDPLALVDPGTNVPGAEGFQKPSDRKESVEQT